MKDDLKYKKNIIIEIIENIDDVLVINFLFKYITKIKERC